MELQLQEGGSSPLATDMPSMTDMSSALRLLSVNGECGSLATLSVSESATVMSTATGGALCTLSALTATLPELLAPSSATTTWTGDVTEPVTHQAQTNRWVDTSEPLPEPRVKHALWAEDSQSHQESAQETAWHCPELIVVCLLVIVGRARRLIRVAGPPPAACLACTHPGIPHLHMGWSLALNLELHHGGTWHRWLVFTVYQSWHPTFGTTALDSRATGQLSSASHSIWVGPWMTSSQFGSMSPPHERCNGCEL